MQSLRLRRLPYDLTTMAGLGLVGEHLNRQAQIDQVFDPAYPVRGIATSDVIRSYLGLLCQGKSDFDAIEAYRQDSAFARLLHISQVPSAATLHQRLDEIAGREAVWRADEANLRFLLRSKGWCVALELRPGSQHSAKEADYTLQRLLPRVSRLSAAPALFRLDSGFDSAALMHELQNWSHARDWILKWNPRRFDVAACLAQREAAPARQWVSLRPGKRQTTWIEQTPDKHLPRRVMRLTERTIDRHGQWLLEPEREIEGWWTTLDWDAQAVIRSYCDHSTHQQFHSEIKTDLDLERLPSGKFNTNDLIMALAMPAYNMLRHLGQGPLLEQDAPLRHTAKRRRIKTVIQELILLAARVTQHARHTWLGLARNCAAWPVFTRY